MKKLTHTFAVCAYQESPYLEACVLSLMKQTKRTNIVIVTSTPNSHIQGVAVKYGIPLYVNNGEAGITQDWNFAYHKAKTDLVTIAHQDDIYLPCYAEKVIAGMEKKLHPLILFTDYAELREGKVTRENRLLKIKRLMLAPLSVSWLQDIRFVRRRILSLGCPICCPAVTFRKENLPDKVFSPGFRSAEDWEAWEKLSRIKGSFIYLPEIGMYHRIHKDSETTAILQEHARVKEDYEMFCKFWPRPIAKWLTRCYSNSEKSNQLSELK